MKSADANAGYVSKLTENQKQTEIKSSIQMQNFYKNGSQTSVIIS